MKVLVGYASVKIFKRGVAYTEAAESRAQTRYSNGYQGGKGYDSGNRRGYRVKNIGMLFRGQIFIFSERFGKYTGQLR